jgi:hypothetical protein
MFRPRVALVDGHQRLRRQRLRTGAFTQPAQQLTHGVTLIEVEPQTRRAERIGIRSEEEDGDAQASCASS